MRNLSLLLVAAGVSLVWAGQPDPAAAQASGPVAAYGMSEGAGTTIADASGNGNTGTLGTGVTWTAQGHTGPGLLFNGTSGRVTIDDAVSLRLAAGMTLEAWVNPQAVTGSWRDVIYKGDDNYYLEATSTNASRPGAGGTFGTAYGAAALAANAWTHLAVTYDRANIRVYVNGTQVSSVAATAAILTSANPLSIGGDAIYGQYFQGTIDDVRVYNRALAAAEIQTDMNTPVGAPAPDTQPPTPPTGLAASSGQYGRVSLSWTPATDNVAVTVYNVHRSTSSGFVAGAANRIGQTVSTAYTDVVAAGTYYYLVTAQDAAANVGPPSNETTGVSAADTQPPTAPGSLAATAAAGQASLSWAPSTDNVGVAGYRLERCPGAGCSTFAQVAAPTAAPYTDAGLAAGMTYGYRVRAADAAGNLGPFSNVASATTPAVSSGLVAAFGFNEASGNTTTDVSGNANTGTLGSGVTWTTAGKYGGALAFNGTSGRVTVADATSLHLAGGATLEAWVKPSTVTAAWRDVVYKPNDNYYLEATSKTGSRPAGGGTFGTTYGTAALAANAWTHLAVTYDRATVRLYVNGSQVSSLAATAAIASSTSPLQIGGDGTYGQYFQGTIDEVRVYNRALSAAEIQTDMNTAVGGTPPPDTTAPTVSITAPANNSAVAGTITVSATASDNIAVAGVQFLLDGASLGAEDTTSPYGVSWSTASAASGPHTLSARARDAAGNTATATAVSVTVDNQPPAGTVVINGGATLTNTTAVTLTLSATDAASAVTQMRFSNDGTTYSAAETYAPSRVWTMATADGTKTVYVQFKDAVGNWSAAATDTIVLDTTPPAISAVTAGGITAGAATIAWTTTEAATSQVEYGKTTSYGSLTALDATLVTSHAVTLASLAAQTSYNYRVRSRDAAGNERLGVNATFTTLASSDRTAPTVVVDFPANGAQLASIVTVTADAADDVGVAGVQFLVDGVNAGTEDTVDPYAFSWDTRTVANGVHTLAARARDAAGNTATSNTVTVNVANSSYFQNEILVTGMNLPTLIKFLPDGRGYIGELGGKVWILQPGATALDPTPFLQLTNIGSLNGQQGLMDLLFDPDFANNHWFYVFYTLGTPNRDRLSRFTANAAATATVAGSEVVLYQDPLDANAEHHGGALNFANDGKLYVTTGEHFTGISQDLTSPRGKILRFNKDGTVPTDNPFYDGSGPNYDAVWARGLRNPYRAFYDAPTGRLYIGDVGGNDNSTSKEELDLGARGANYGWPDCEGPCNNPAVTDPIYWYPHSGRDACITGGFIYRGSQYPPDYQGNYFFADYAQNWIKRLTFDASGNVSGVFNFEPLDGSADGPYGDIVYLAQGPDGSLYYVDLGYSDTTGTHGISKIRRIRFIQSNLPPIATVDARPTEGPEPLTVNFSSAGSSDPEGQPLTYSWAFGDGGTSTAANPVHTYTVRGGYTVRLTVSDGVNSTLAAPLSINAGNPPIATVVAPTDGSLFRAGDVIAYSGTGTDALGNSLPAGAFTWSIDFLHEGHVHPGLPTTGVRSGTFTIPTSGHDFSGNTRYRFALTVTDADGLTATQSVIVWPEKVNLTFGTQPPGLNLYLDGVAHTAPFVYDTLINFVHTVDARNQSPYSFSSWSDAGAQMHSITVPSLAQSYTAAYTTAPPPPTGLVAAWGFNEGTGTTTADDSSNGNAGTLVNGPTWTTGHTGGAILFDGVDDRVRVADSSSLDLTSAATFEAWVYPTSAPSGWRTILQKETDAYFFTASSDQASHPAAGGTFNGACCTSAYATSALAANTWTHVAATYDGSQLRFFLNGAQVASVLVTGSYQVNSNPLWIGGNAVYGEHFQGKLDDVRIYNRALSATEIQQDMAIAVP